MAGFRWALGAELPGDDAPTDDWMASRAAQRALRDYVEAAGRAAWARSTTDGDPLSAPQADDVVALGAQTLGAGAPLDGNWSAEAANDDAPKPIQPVQPDGPLTHPPDVRFATARPGDSISRLAGSSDPAAIGRFLSLNGMRPGNSTILSGRNYAVPTGVDDATEQDWASGRAALRNDNARLAAIRADRAERAREAMRWRAPLGSGRNVWTGEVVGGGEHRYFAPPSPQRASRPARTWLDDSPLAKEIGGEAAQFAGQGYGVIRGGFHSIEGLINGAGFLASLPFDESARQQAATMANKATNYARTRAADLSLVGDDARNWVKAENLKLNPNATPAADTLSGELQRRFGIGANQGEVGFDVGSVLFGGEIAKGLEGLAVARELPAVQKYVRATLPPYEAEYMLQPYVGMGAHYIPRKTRLPRVLGGGPLPKALMDSRFNVSKLRGATRWQQYKHHFMNDPDYHGGPIQGRRGKGSGWSGDDLGWTRNDPLMRMIAGMPADTKGVLGGAGAAGLNAGYDISDGDQ